MDRLLCSLKSLTVLFHHFRYQPLAIGKLFLTIHETSGIESISSSRRICERQDLKAVRSDHKIQTGTSISYQRKNLPPATVLYFILLKYLSA